MSGPIEVQKFGAGAGSNTDATTYATASLTPVSGGKYYFASVALRLTGQSVEPTLVGTNGWNVTWTKESTLLIGSNLRITVFSGTASSGTAGTLTPTYTGETQSAHAYGIVGPILNLGSLTPVQIKTNTAAAATAITVTPDSAAADAYNAFLFFVANDAATGSASGTLDDVYYTTLGSQVAAGDGARLAVRFGLGNVTAMTASGMVSSNVGGIVFELDHDGNGIGNTNGPDQSLGEHMNDVRQANATSVSLDILVVSTTTGAGVTGKVAADFTSASWARTDGANTAETDITLADLAAINSAYSSGGIKQIDATKRPGVYRIDIPNAVFSSGAPRADITIVGSGFIGRKVVDIVADNPRAAALTASEINAEVVDAISVDTYGEPAQGAPAATASLATKIGFLFKQWRNKKTFDGTTEKLFNDDAATVDHKRTVTDDATTLTKGEVATGP